MSNQDFNATDGFSSIDHNGGENSAPVPIGQRITTQQYLSNVQQFKDDLKDAEGEHESSIASNNAAHQPTHAQTHSQPPKANKMDAFFEKVAREEEEARIALEQAESGVLEADAATPDQSDVAAEVEASDNQHLESQHLESQHLESSNVTNDFEPPAQEEPAPTRPTGAAGLSAGLAAAGLGAFAATLAQSHSTEERQSPYVDNTQEPQDPAAAEDPYTEVAFSDLALTTPPVDPSALPQTNFLNPAEASDQNVGFQPPINTPNQLDLEAALLDEETAPLYSQQFDEQEPSPEAKLENRLRRENLLRQPENYDQPQAPGAEMIEPMVEVPEQSFDPALSAQRPLEINRRGDQTIQVPPSNAAAPVPLSHEAPSQHLVEDPAAATGASPAEAFPENNPYEQTVATQQGTPSDGQQYAADVNEAGFYSEPDRQAKEHNQLTENESRLQEAERLELEHRQRQSLEQESSASVRSDLERFEQERIAAEESMAEQLRKQRENELDEVLLKADSDKAAAVLQAERVKQAREAAQNVAQTSPDQTSPVPPSQPDEEPTIAQQTANSDSPVPQPLVESPNVQFTDQPALISPGTLRSDEPSIHGEIPVGEDVVKRPIANQHFQFELFNTCLLQHLFDGVVFVDHQSQVKMWSRGAEKMTGITPNVVLERPLFPQTINLRDTNDSKIELSACPIAESLRSLTIVRGEYKIANNTSQGLKVELMVIPVIDENRYVNGAVVMFHDRSAQVDLQRQLKDLYEFSVLDPLTQVANRAEFERVQQEYVLAFQQSQHFKCSIIICDIDYFKSINDKFGHTVGDQALVAFAQMLKRFVRSQDFVARYGGEEFVILCADCDTSSAVQRAEEIRMALYKTAQPMLEGKSISASFGVSELREGDTSMDFFIRADTALLKAKESGRNRVVASEGSGVSNDTSDDKEISASGIQWQQRRRENASLLCEEFQTQTPTQVLIEKLRGFIIEKDAILQRVEPEFVSMEVVYEVPNNYTRKGTFTMNIEFSENEVPRDIDGSATKKINYMRVTIYSGRMRKWFATNHIDLAPQLLAELRTYLMINDKASRISVDMATKNVR